jgi:Tfp pilus assembly protein PilX
MTPHININERPVRRRVRRRRSGMVLVAALVCLLIVTSLVGSMLQGTLRARRQLHAERDRRQTELLLEAGADRAASRLAAEPDFRGETWQVPAEAIVGRGEGRVTTEVSSAADNQLPSEQSWQVRVVAEYPLGSGSSIRRSRTFFVTSPNTQVQE